MYKKIFIGFLLVAITNLLTGCYSSKLVTAQEFNQIEEEGKPAAIDVITKDGKEYHLSGSNFYVANDTLNEKIVIAVMEKWLPFEGKIAFDEIEEIEFYNYKYDWTYRITISEYEQIEKDRGKPEEIFLIKFDSTTYHFMKDDYFIENDTLYGNGKSFLEESERILNRKIPLSNIESIEFKSRSFLYRILLGLGFVAILLILFGLVVALPGD